MEKRRFSRVPFRIQAEIQAGGQYFTAKVENLSLRGMFISTDQTIELHTPLTIKINLTGAQSSLVLNLEGKAVRTTPDGIGVFFATMDLDSFIHLKNIIDYNSADPEKIFDEFLHYVRENLEKGQEL